MYRIERVRWDGVGKGHIKESIESSNLAEVGMNLLPL